MVEGGDLTKSSVTACIRSCCRAGLIKEGLMVLANMRDRWGLDPDVDCYLPILAQLTERGDVVRACELLQEMEDDGLSIPGEVYERVAMTCAQHKDAVRAALVMEMSRYAGHLPSLDCCVSTIACWHEAGNHRAVTAMAHDANKVKESSSCPS